MPQTPIADVMKTLVTNTSGDDLFLGYLPPHGQLVKNGATVICMGDLSTVLASGLNRYNRTRELTAFEFDITHGKISVEFANPYSSSSNSNP